MGREVCFQQRRHGNKCKSNSRDTVVGTKKEERDALELSNLCKKRR